MQKKYNIYFLLAFIMIVTVWMHFTITAEAKKDIVVVIDPGHGGTNLGAEYNGVTEKNATIKVAAAMKDELEKYDGVVVYLTRTGDESMELLERAEFARDVKADIILSLHFNMSELHDLHGSEMWISSAPGLKAEAEQFAKIEQMLLADYGIERRGCFTRLNDLGNDYYGIIRESSSFQIPAVIVEHCYLDRPEEYQFYDTDAALDRLGRIDATAVAMAYRLTSEELGVDYTRHYVANTALPENLFVEDTTAPEEVILEIGDFNEDNNILNLHLSVKEEESIMSYYEISFDGGETFSEPITFYSENEIDFITAVYPTTDCGLMVRAYNAYGLYTDSEVYDTNLLLFGMEEPALDDEMIITGFITDVLNEIENITEELPPEVQNVAKWVLIIGSVLGLITVLCLFIQNRRKSNISNAQSEAKGA